MRLGEMQRLRILLDKVLAGEPVHASEALDAGVDFARMELALQDQERAFSRVKEGCAKIAEKHGAKETAHAIRKCARPGR